MMITGGSGRGPAATVRATIAGMLAAAVLVGIAAGCRRWVVWLPARPTDLAEQTRRAAATIDELKLVQGICVILGDEGCELACDLARNTDLLLYVQLESDETVEAARQAADEAGFNGTRIFVEKGGTDKIHLAGNIADFVVARGEAARVPGREALRVLRPGGVALLGRKELTKRFPRGLDDWSHPYHGPDNNPQSRDRVIHAPYLTQFLAEPRYAPLPQVAVASGGRVFKAFGNVAFKKREEPFLNTLVAFNGYNGSMLWKRPLTSGVAIHRNAMIATPSTLYLGDDKSCKVIDAATGGIITEIAPPEEKVGGTFWKWMAMEKGVLYAVIGEQEQKDPVMRWNREAHGWPWTKVSRGYNQKEHVWGFGRTVVAIDPKTKQVLWTHREDEPIDCRAVCMKKGRIYLFRFGSFLTCLDAKRGKVVWRRTKENDPELFESLGNYLNRQGWETNWRTTAYLKCSDKALFFSGPQVGKLLVVSARNGGILWEDPYDNFQLILRDKAVYGISGPWKKTVSRKFHPRTGRVLAEINIGRRACARPTGALDAIFFRAMGGSVRFDLDSEQPQWISPMRAQCHDGVTIANGMLYWWPSTCDCQLSLYGVTALGPAGKFDFDPRPVEAAKLERGCGDNADVARLPESPEDWPTFRADNARRAATEATVPEAADRVWDVSPSREFVPTAPVAAGGLVFLGGSDGAVRAFDAETGESRWTAFTGGAIRIPPTIAEGRALVGSGDGWVYAFEAKTGRLLWRFRAAPEERKIPVYGTLLSTWPVASGVLVDDGIAYVAAGIVNYDGTHVYALDAATGEVQWQNSTSGHLYPEARTGVSVQGHLLLHDGKLYLAGGTAVSPAAYDATDGRCLNNPEQLERCESICPRGRELSLIGDRVVACGRPLYADPRYPIYDRSVERRVFIARNGDRDVIWQDGRKLLCFPRIDRDALNKCVHELKYGGHVITTWGELKVDEKSLWARNCTDSVAVAVCRNAVVVAKISEVVALSLKNGEALWSDRLPASPVPWGLAVDCEGRASLTLEDGRVMCYGRRGREVARAEP